MQVRFWIIWEVCTAFPENDNVTWDKTYCRLDVHCDAERTTQVSLKSLPIHWKNNSCLAQYEKYIQTNYAACF